MCTYAFHGRAPKKISSVETRPLRDTGVSKQQQAKYTTFASTYMGVPDLDRPVVGGSRKEPRVRGHGDAVHRGSVLGQVGDQDACA
jgi:hypothetical protein